MKARLTAKNPPRLEPLVCGLAEQLAFAPHSSPVQLAVAFTFRLDVLN
jgi:hypothetical protein